MKFLMILGQHGNRPGYFAHPCGLATDSFGNIYVADKQFENIQIFNSQGQILMAIGGEGHEPGQFWLPAGIFIDDNDSLLASVQLGPDPNFGVSQNMAGVVVGNDLIISEDGNNRLLRADLDTYEIEIFRDLSDLSGWLGAIDYSDGVYCICQSQ